MSLLDEKRVRSVVKRCAEQGVRVSERLASALFRCYTLNPNVNTDLEKRPLGKTAVKRIVEQCVDDLSVRENPIVSCVKMQLILEHDYKNKESIINVLNEENDRKIRPLLNRILDDNNTGGDAATVDENGISYRQLIQYIIVTNYMGDPTSPRCIRQTAAALNTAVDRKKLSDWQNQSPSSKRKRLKETASLACAVRLCNGDRTDCKEIIDMINTLPNAVGLLLQNVDGELKNGIETATIITSWIRQCYKVDDDLSAPLFVMRTRLATIRNDELDKYKIFLVFYLQYRRNLEIIKGDLSKCKYDELPTILNKYNAKLSEIKFSFKNTNNFNDSELINLSAVWTEIIEIINYLSVTANLILTMKQMINETIDIKELVKYSQQTTTTRIFPIVDKEQVKIIETHPLHPMCRWYSPSYEMENGKKLFADGYCVVMIVETNGALMKHDRNLGIIQYCDEWFGFSCIQAALNFGTKPAEYLNCFYNLLRCQAHLLSFFHSYEHISETQYVSNRLMRAKYKSIKYKDAQVQTIRPNDTSAMDDNKYARSAQKTKHRAAFGVKRNQRVNTLNAQKSIHVQTISSEVGCNTMREKSTCTDQLMFANMF